MTFKQIIDEQLDFTNATQQLNQLNQTVEILNQKISKNPDLAKAYGNELATIGNMSKGVTTSFQAMVQQQLAEKKEKERKEAAMKLTTQNNLLKQPTTASNTVSITKPQANGYSTAQKTANGTV